MIQNNYHRNQINIIWTLLIISILVSQVNCISASETHISSTRNSYRSSSCSLYSGSYTSSDIQSAKSYLTQYDYLSEAEIQAILFDRNLLNINSNTLLMVIPHAVTLGIMLILWLPLCCCCSWPEKHPVCRKCRKPEKESYKNCELKWTSYVSVLCYLMVLIGGILAIMEGADIINYISDVGCKITAIPDDILYGRLSPTVSGRFFTGISPFSADLTSFKTNFNTIWTQSQSSLDTASDVKSKQIFYQNQISSIYNLFPKIQYEDAFAVDSTTTYQNVTSQFKTLFYGPETINTTILGKAYYKSSIIFEQINNVLDPMIAAWGRLKTTTKTGVQTQMTTTNTEITSITTQLQDLIKDIASGLDNGDLYGQAILALTAFFGCFVGLAFLGTLASVLLACFSVVRIRLVMYFTCGLMYFLAIFTFIFLILLGILGPTISQICTYTDAKLSTGAGTYDFFSKLGSQKTGSLLRNCMEDGTGAIMGDLSSTFSTSYEDIITITRGAQRLNDLIPNYSTSNLVTPLSEGVTLAGKVSNAQLLEITDTVALSFIDKVRLVTIPRLNCLNPTNVEADSWYPSSTLYSCPSGKAINPPCNDLSSFTACPAGCYELMVSLTTPAGDTSYTFNLDQRYGGINCNYYIFIKNLHQNWNIVRKADMNGVITSLNTLTTHVTNYDNSFKTVQASLTTFKNILQTNFIGTTNLNTGTFQGMDCRVIGQSVQDFRNAVCVGLLGSINYNILVMILLSYGSLLIACCATCAGVRHFKHLQKMKIHTGYKGVPVSITDQPSFTEK